MAKRKKVSRRVGAGKRKSAKGLLDMAKKAINAVKPVLRQTKFLSKAAAKIPHVGSALSTHLKRKGYGRRRARGGMRVHAAVMPRNKLLMDPRMQGAGFFGDVWSGIKKGFNVLKPVLKSTKILSKAAKLIPGVGQPLSIYAKSQGYGRKRGGRVLING